MKYKIVLTALLFWTASLAGNPAWSAVNMQYLDLVQPGQMVGQIKGSVKSCSKDFNMSGTLVHIPGISVATRLGTTPEFHLLSVPQGEYTLVFEYGEQKLSTIQRVSVQANKLTAIDSVTLCPDNDGDGYNLTADLDDANASVYPGAKEVCDRIDNNGDGVVDEGCSHRKCPKGGNFCLSNWNNSNRILRAAKPATKQPANAGQPSSAFTEVKP